MSSALMRRNSSKQGLQNLLRVTAQRSIEDAEEIERERRRRAREAFRREGSLSGSTGSPQDSEGLAEACASVPSYDSELKPSSSAALEEDEGFSDWTQRLERGRLQRQEENGQREEEKGVNGAAESVEETHTTVTTTTIRQRQREEEEEGEEDNQSMRRTFGERTHSQMEREAEGWTEEDRTGIKKSEMKEKRKEVNVSHTSKVFLQQEEKLNNTHDDSAEEVTSNLIKVKRTPSRSLSQAQGAREEEVVEVAACLETEQRLEKIRCSQQEKESQELEQLRQRQAEAEVELEEMKRRREERRRVREEEEHRREEEEQQRVAKEEEERRRMKDGIERRRMEAAERRRKSLNTSCTDGDEMFNPLSPKGPMFKRENEEGLTAENTRSITERTESLNRSLKKSNSFKKTQPPVLLSKIDDRLEQYTHAIESSSKEAKAAVVNIPSVPQPVASKKSLFEAGEAWSQSSPKGTPSKDTEGVKVGVADLITNWVKGNPDGSNRNSPSRPADVKPGDVLQKKNMWEIIGEVSSPIRSGGKGTPSGKRYKFIVTGHGKYEKIPVDDDDYSDYSNGKSSDLCHDEF